MLCASCRMRSARSMTCWPGGGDAREIAALAHEDLKAELVLEQLDLLADPGLRGMQLLGGRGDVETALGDGGEVTQLVQLHKLKPNPTANRSVSRL